MNHIKHQLDCLLRRIEETPMSESVESPKPGDETMKEIRMAKMNLLLLFKTAPKENIAPNVWAMFDGFPKGESYFICGHFSPLSRERGFFDLDLDSFIYLGSRTFTVLFAERSMWFTVFVEEQSIRFTVPSPEQSMSFTVPAGSGRSVTRWQDSPHRCIHDLLGHR